jgi:triacylglycerol lipase
MVEDHLQAKTFKKSLLFLSTETVMLHSVEGPQMVTICFYLGYTVIQTGFQSLAQYLTAQGYNSAELYTTTWGTGNLIDGPLCYHSKEVILRLRKFVEAVLVYTGASHVNVIGHSMGVTLARKVLKGGSAKDHKDGVYNIGDSLAPYVKSFVGLAGGNLGLANCVASSVIPTCGDVDGFYPGLTILSGPSTFLHNLNQNGGK